MDGLAKGFAPAPPHNDADEVADAVIQSTASSALNPNIGLSHELRVPDGGRPSASNWFRRLYQ